MTSRGRKEGETDRDVFESSERGGRGGLLVIMRIKAKNRGKCLTERIAGEEKGMHSFLSAPTFSKR